MKRLIGLLFGLLVLLAVAASAAAAENDKGAMMENRDGMARAIFAGGCFWTRETYKGSDGWGSEGTSTPFSILRRTWTTAGSN